MLKPTFRFLGCHDDFAALQFHARVLIDALRIEARGRPAGRQRQRETKAKAGDYYPQAGCPWLLPGATITAGPLRAPSPAGSHGSGLAPWQDRTAPLKTAAT